MNLLLLDAKEPIENPSSATFENHPEPVWDCSEASRFLRIHPATVKRLAREGKLPAFRIGNRWRFRHSELDAWARSTVLQRTLCAANRGGPHLRQNTDHFGWIEKQKRREGPSVVVWRYRQKQSDGSYKKLTVLLGTAQQLKTVEAAWREAELNPLYASLEAGLNEQVRFGALCNRYIEHAIPPRRSTRKSYMTNLNKHILPRWQYTPLAEVRPMFVQDWLDELPLAARTKGKIKALMHRLFEKAMFWELVPVGRNPMALVEIQGSSRRRKKPIILTVEQYFALLELLPEPYRTMVVVAQCLGLRVSEILALQWPDINFAELTMRVTRGVVDAVVDEVKTEYSEDDLPLDPGLATVLLSWKERCPESEEGWMFPTPAPRALPR